MSERECLVAFEICGCLSAVVVVTDNQADAYKSAASWAKRGDRIEGMTVAAFRDVPLHCPDHPNGPPWWKSKGGNGKRPAEWAPQTALGLAAQPLTAPQRGAITTVKSNND